jgi:hypothetical protein
VAIPRRPVYGRLVEPTESLPVMSVLAEPPVPDQENRRMAVVPGNGAFDADALIARCGLRRQEADLVVSRGARRGRVAGGPPRIEERARARGALAFAVCTNGCTQGQSAVLVTPDGTYEHVATHGRGVVLGETPAAVVPTPVGNVGLLCGDEGLVPEVARCLALEGADVLAWPLFEAHPQAGVARCRSDENRVYAAAAWPDGGVITSPRGRQSRPCRRAPASRCRPR